MVGWLAQEHPVCGERMKSLVFARGRAPIGIMSLMAGSPISMQMTILSEMLITTVPGVSLQ